MGCTPFRNKNKESLRVLNKHDRQDLNYIIVKPFECTTANIKVKKNETIRIILKETLTNDITLICLITNNKEFLIKENTSINISDNGFIYLYIDANISTKDQEPSVYVNITGGESINYVCSRFETYLSTSSFLLYNKLLDFINIGNNQYCKEYLINTNNLNEMTTSLKISKKLTYLAVLISEYLKETCLNSINIENCQNIQEYLNNLNIPQDFHIICKFGTKNYLLIIKDLIEFNNESFNSNMKRIGIYFSEHPIYNYSCIIVLSKELDEEDKEHNLYLDSLLSNCNFII